MISGNLIPFDFEGKKVRAVVLDNAPWWVGKDVAEALSYKDPTTALRSHCRGVQKLHPLQTPGGVQDLRILGLPDVTRLIAGSHLPEAVRFEKWIFEEILPSVMTKGYYTAKGLNPGMTLDRTELQATIDEATRTIRTLVSSNQLLRRENMLLNKIDRLEADIHKKGSKLTKEEIYMAHSMKQQGKTATQVAALLGRSSSTVRRYLKGGRS